jgi:hypothetical protein
MEVVHGSHKVLTVDNTVSTSDARHTHGLGMMLEPSLTVAFVDKDGQAKSGGIEVGDVVTRVGGEDFSAGNKTDTDVVAALTCAKENGVDIVVEFNSPKPLLTPPKMQRAPRVKSSSMAVNVTRSVVASDEQVARSRQERLKRASDAQMRFRAVYSSLVLFYLMSWSVIYMFLMEKDALCADGEGGCKVRWNFADAFCFVVVVTTTVGYGDFHFIDESPGMKILFMIQSILGFSLLASIALESELAIKRAELAGKEFLVRGEDEESHPDDDLKRSGNAIRLTVARVVLLLLGASIFYSYQEDLEAMTSLYFAYVSLSTIGFGDYTVHSAASKVFTAVLLLWGTGEFATFVGQLASYHFDRFSYVHMRKLLELEHKGDFIAQLDNERDGTVSSGQFLAGYLVSGTRVKRFAFFCFLRVLFSFISSVGAFAACFLLAPFAACNVAFPAT